MLFKPVIISFTDTSFPNKLAGCFGTKTDVPYSMDENQETKEYIVLSFLLVVACLDLVLGVSKQLFCIFRRLMWNFCFHFEDKILKYRLI